MRFCTGEWQDDAYYFASAIREVHRLKTLCSLSEDSKFLDIGSGQGRMAIGLQAVFPGLRSYLGLDVHAPSVDWCNRHLARPNFQFRHVNYWNDRYNPQGRPPDRLPVRDAAVDIAFLYSVFTHMRLRDIEQYLGEVARVLASGGWCFLTIYAEEWSRPEDENPTDYLSELGAHTGALHHVVIDRKAFEGLCVRSGLSVARFMYRSEDVTKQSAYLLSKTSQ